MVTRPEQTIGLHPLALDGYRPVVPGTVPHALRCDPRTLATLDLSLWSKPPRHRRPLSQRMRLRTASGAMGVHLSAIRRQRWSSCYLVDGSGPRHSVEMSLCRND